MMAVSTATALCKALGKGTVLGEGTTIPGLAHRLEGADCQARATAALLNHPGYQLPASCGVVGKSQALRFASEENG